MWRSEPGGKALSRRIDGYILNVVIAGASDVGRIRQRCSRRTQLGHKSVAARKVRGRASRRPTRKRGLICPCCNREIGGFGVASDIGRTMRIHGQAKRILAAAPTEVGGIDQLRSVGTYLRYHDIATNRVAVLTAHRRCSSVGSLEGSRGDGEIAGERARGDISVASWIDCDAGTALGLVAAASEIGEVAQH